MPRWELLVFGAVVLLGTLDWATTVTGIVFRGAVETNPLLAIATSSLPVFSAIKLAAVSLAGLAFYKAASMCGCGGGGKFAARFLAGGSCLTVLFLTAVVANNVIAIVSV